MPVLRLAALLTLLALSLGSAQAARLALVIGNAAYVDSPLRNPVNDARAMEVKLRHLGFSVTKVENLKRDQIGRTLTGFASRIQPGDAVVVFYAGHGLQVKGVNYLPAVDAQIHSEDDVPLNSLNLGALLDRLDEAKAGVKLLFLDACRNNPYARSFRSGARGLARVVDAPSGTLMHFATRPGSVAADGIGANGLYTTELLKHLDRPGLPVELMLKDVAAGVERASNGQQEPWSEGSLRGNFYFGAETLVQQPPVQAQPATPAPEAGLDFAALQREMEQGQAQRAEAERQQARLEMAMQADFDKLAALPPDGELARLAWPRFEQAWPATRLDSPKARELRARAQTRGTAGKACPECPETVLLQPGSFQMGSPASETGRDADEGPVHEVRIDYKLAVGKTHITKGEFAAFVNASGYRPETDQGNGCFGWTGSEFEKRGNFTWRSPGFEQNDDHPVVCVSWNDTQKYIAWLNERSPVKGWRLLSEAEWEYAARAGTTTRYFWGEDGDSSQQCVYANGADQSAKRAGHPGLTEASCDDGYARTAPAGHFKANAWGLYDMAGNAWQWTQDCFTNNYGAAPSNGSAVNASECSMRVRRGGFWSSGTKWLRPAVRDRAPPDNRAGRSGFRVARTVN